MKFRVLLLLVLIILSAGCLENLVKKDVLYVKVLMNETGNRTVIKSINVSQGKIPAGNAPKDVQPAFFPAIGVQVIQNKNIISYISGYDYKGPGMYNITVAFQQEINKSVPMVVFVGLYGKDGKRTAQGTVFYNWTVS